MALLPYTGLETHPTGTVNVTGIINGDWETIERIFNPALSSASPQHGVIWRALGGQAGLTTITYAASVDLDLEASYPVNLLALTGNVTIAFTGKAAGRHRWIALQADGTARNVTWPGAAVWSGDAVATVPAGETIIVLVISLSTTDASVVLVAFSAPSYASLGIVPKEYGGSGADNSALTFPGSGVLATTDDIAASVNGLSWKQAVRCKTTANVNLSGGGLANGTTHDGVTVATGDRVLVEQQTLPEQNGIYIVPASGAASRSTDANSAAEMLNLTVFVSEGTAHEDEQWTCTTDNPITLGTTPLVFVAMTAGAGYTADETSLHLAGSVFEIKTTWPGHVAITTVGTLTSGSTGAGFTVALSAATVTGTLGAANGGTGIDTSAATGFYKLAAGTHTVESAATHRTSLGLAIGSDVQAYSAVIAGIVGLTPTNDDVMQYKAGAWANRTIAQLTTDLQGTGLSATTCAFRGIPQNSQSAAYTVVAADNGQHILHPSADTTARIFTIPSNAALALPIGFTVTFINQDSAGVITIAITTDTMRLAGAGTTGSRTLAANGIATAVKLTATEWIISGTNLT